MILLEILPRYIVFHVWSSVITKYHLHFYAHYCLEIILKNKYTTSLRNFNMYILHRYIVIIVLKTDNEIKIGSECPFLSIFSRNILHRGSLKKNNSNITLQCANVIFFLCKSIQKICAIKQKSIFTPPDRRKPPNAYCMKTNPSFP